MEIIKHPALQKIIMHKEGAIMKRKTTANTMKIVGATLAVGSALALMGATKCDSSKQIKKAVQKTADPVLNAVDTVANYM